MFGVKLDNALQRQGKAALGLLGDAVHEVDADIVEFCLARGLVCFDSFVESVYACQIAQLVVATRFGRL